MEGESTRQVPLARRVALVTGAGRGIGLAAARQLAALGASVFLGLRKSSSRSSVASLVRDVQNATIIDLDVASLRSAESAIERIATSAGRLDILISNAGTILPICHLIDSDPAEWRRSVEVNLHGAYHVARSALPLILQQPSSTVISLSSNAAKKPFEGWSAYCVGKAAADMLIRALHVELAERGVRAFNFIPGVVDTGMQSEIRKSGMNPVSKLKRGDLSPVERPAQAIGMLCTEAGNPWVGQDASLRDPIFAAAVDDFYAGAPVPP